MTNTHIHVPERPYWDRDIYGSAMHNGVPVFSKLGRGPKGDKGDAGPAGPAGANGTDGVSPEIQTGTDEQTGSPTVRFKDRNGWSEWVVLTAGADGHSVSAVVSGTTVTFVNEDDPTEEYGSITVDVPSFDPSTLTSADCVNIESAITDAGVQPTSREYSWTPTDTPVAYSSNTAWCELTISDAKRNSSSSSSQTTLSSVADDESSMNRVAQWYKVKFFRNGLEYKRVFYMSEAHRLGSSYVFSLSADRTKLYFYPKPSSGSGKLEDCSIIVELAKTDSASS